MIVLGIDPGLNGGLAWVDDTGALLHTVPMPSVKARGKGNELSYSLLAREVADVSEDAVMIERVGARPGQGVSSMFKFGTCYGAVIMLAAMRMRPTHFVTPTMWKAALRLPAAKDAARALAMQLWPENADKFSRAKDDGVAEAALIAYYGVKELRV